MYLVETKYGRDHRGLPFRLLIGQFSTIKAATNYIQKHEIRCAEVVEMTRRKKVQDNQFGILDRLQKG